MNNEVMFSSKNQAWSTRLEFFEPVNDQYHFTLDAAASDDDHRCPRYFTEEQNGLEQSWSGERVWLNPPYGNYVDRWIQKAYEESVDCMVVMLIKARTDTKAWHRYIWDKESSDWRPGVRGHLLPGRLTFGSDAYWEWVWEQEFIDGKRNSLYKKYGKMNPAPFPSALIVFDRREVRLRDGWELIQSLHKAIDRKFEINSWKGHWRDLSTDNLVGKMLHEVGELMESVDIRNFDNAIYEAADIALFAAMVADENRWSPLKLVKE